MKEISITEIEGIAIGHATDEQAGTGCTVILAPNGAIAGVDVRGGGPATRETDLLKPVNMVDTVFAVMLSGGSAYGLDACSGAMKYLEEKGIGFDVGVGVVPIVCGASLFDLCTGSANIRPDAAMGYAACKAAELFGKGELAQGSVGAGTGATVGKLMGAGRMMKSGIGHYALQVGDLKVGAIVAVNALGDVLDFKSRRTLAGLLSEDLTELCSTEELILENYDKLKNVFTGNTTIGLVVTNARMTKTEATKLASIGQNGFADVIRPVHTMADGDSLFVMSVGDVKADALPVGVLARLAVAGAIDNAVMNAEPGYGLMCAQDFLKQEK